MEKGPEILEYAVPEVRGPRFTEGTRRFWTLAEVWLRWVAVVGIVVPMFWGSVPPKSGVGLMLLFLLGCLAGVMWVGVAMVYALVVLADRRAIGTGRLLMKVAAMLVAIGIVGSTKVVKPVRWGFVVSESALDAMADRIAAGETLTKPEWCGIYRIRSGWIMPSGDVVLVQAQKGDVGVQFVRRSPKNTQIVVFWPRGWRFLEIGSDRWLANEGASER